MLFIGSKRRIKAPTENNEFSSRSHALVEIRILNSVCVDGRVVAQHGKALLVDLAGSERLGTGGGGECSDRREEGKNINKSL